MLTINYAFIHKEIKVDLNELVKGDMRFTDYVDESKGLIFSFKPSPQEENGVQVEIFTTKVTEGDRWAKVVKEPTCEMAMTFI